MQVKEKVASEPLFVGLFVKLADLTPSIVEVHPFGLTFKNKSYSQEGTKSAKKYAGLIVPSICSLSNSDVASDMTKRQALPIPSADDFNSCATLVNFSSIKDKADSWSPLSM